MTGPRTVTTGSPGKNRRSFRKPPKRHRQSQTPAGSLRTHRKRCPFFSNTEYPRLQNAGIPDNAQAVPDLRRSQIPLRPESFGRTYRSKRSCPCILFQNSQAHRQFIKICQHGHVDAFDHDSSVSVLSGEMSFADIQALFTVFSLFHGSPHRPRG